MMYTLESFFDAAQPYISTFNEWVNKYRPQGKADHICYKCESTEEFEAILKLFQFNSQYIYQSIISSRRIAIVKFIKPLVTDLGEIWFLELSDQKPDGSQMSGYDHIEMYPLEGDSNTLASYPESTHGIMWEKVVRPHHTTYDLILKGNFKIRLEDELLVNKIKREEII